MNADSYAKALLEELRSPRDKGAEATIRAELARLGVAAPSPKELKVQAATERAQAPAPTETATAS